MGEAPANFPAFTFSYCPKPWGGGGGGGGGGLLNRNFDGCAAGPPKN